MIAYLIGTILEKAPNKIILNVNNVGYEIFVSLNTYYNLSDHESQVKLHTQFIVREDAQLLYGFYTATEKQLFNLLIKINGVGPKLALAILSGSTQEEFMQAVINNDVASLVKLPGVGKKTAERLLIEMKDKLKTLDGLNLNLNQLEQTSVNSSARRDALDALLALGYKTPAIDKILSKFSKDDYNSETLIKLALKELN